MKRRLNMIIRLCVAIIFLSGSTWAAASDLPEFEARYQINYGSLRLGEATYRLTRSETGALSFDFASSLRFLIFSDRRTVRSELTWSPPRLVPSRYIHDRKGTGRDYVEEIRFDREGGTIRSSVDDEFEDFGYDEAIVDGLTVQLQMMIDLQRGIEQPSYRILDDNRVRQRDFRLVGEETLTIEGKPSPTVIYEVVRDNKRRTTQMWFDRNREYLPVQMVHYSDGKKKFNAFLVHYRPDDG